MSNHTSEPVRLKNGLLFLHKKIPGSGIVDVRVMLRSGGKYDKSLAVPPGTAHFLEHIVHERTEKYESREALMKAIETCGGTRNATTYTTEKMDFFGTVLSEHAEIAADYVSQITSHPVLTDEATEKHRSIIIQECLSRMKQPEVKAWSAFKKAILGGTGYEHRSLGTLESIAQISRADMQKFYDARFLAENAILSIYGDIDFDKAFALAEKYFSAMKTRQSKNSFSFEPVPEAEDRCMDMSKKYEHVEIADAQSVTMYGGTMPGRSGELHFPISVMLQILAGDFTSILYRILRDDKHLLYHVGFSTDRADTFGVFAFSMNIAPENIQPAIDIIKAEVQKAANGEIDDEMIALAKTRIKAREVFSLQTVQSIADSDVTTTLLFPNLATPDEWLKRIEAVTKDDLIAAAKHIRDHLTVLSVCSNAPEAKYEF